MKPFVKGWITAFRLKTLPAALGPILPGAALAWSGNEFRPGAVTAALVSAILLQITVNVSNDYFDFVKGIDRPGRLGPERAAASGLLSLKSLRAGMIMLTFLIIFSGLYLVYIAGLPILIVGVVSIISAFLYSSGPYPLSSNALGDLFVFIFFGPVAVCGTYYVQTLTLNYEIGAFSVSIGFLITAIIVVNNYRDIESDTAANKRTLAVLLGRKMMFIEYSFLIFSAYLIPVGLVFLFKVTPWILLVFMSLPLSIPLVLDMKGRVSGKRLNKTLAGTAMLGLLFSILLSLGIVLG